MYSKNLAYHFKVISMLSDQTVGYAFSDLVAVFSDKMIKNNLF
jgi:hypothetical protein